ncbi:hypothetical protein SPWS13_1692 [Shewanella putrefaciens]|nr:hypothetical protein SPWS13_1692 [Shewanella putrefaciens]
MYGMQQYLKDTSHYGLSFRLDFATPSGLAHITTKSPK